MKKKIVAMIMMLSCTAIVACSSKEPETKLVEDTPAVASTEASSEATEEASLEASVEESTAEASSDESIPDELWCGTLENFTFKGSKLDSVENRAAYLTDELYKDVKDNVLFSPLSLNMALGMLNNSAEGDTQHRINEFLGTSKYNEIAKDIMDRYYHEDAGEDPMEYAKKEMTEYFKYFGKDEDEVAKYNETVKDIMDRYYHEDAGGDPMESAKKEMTKYFKHFGKDEDEAAKLAKAAISTITGIDCEGEYLLLLDDFINSLNDDDDQSVLYDMFDNIEYYEYENANMDTSIFDVANSIWISDDREIIPSFKEDSDTYYKAHVDSIDVTNPKSSCDKVNDWVDGKTRGLIPKIINESQISKDTSAILVNTIYFNAQWVEEWYTKEGTFTNVAGNKKELEVIRNEATRYYENDKATAFGISYKNNMQFVGILPKEDGDFNLLDLDIRGLLKEDKSSEYDIINAEMPRLKYETDNGTIKDTLTSIGLDRLFSRSAQFPNLVRQKSEEKTYIDDIIQKCTIDLDEYGTEASAATAIIMKTDAMAPIEKEPTIVDVVLNRPFAFVIIDRETNQIVFMGKVVNVK